MADVDGEIGEHGVETEKNVGEKGHGELEAESGVGEQGHEELEAGSGVGEQKRKSADVFESTIRQVALVSTKSELESALPPIDRGKLYGCGKMLSSGAFGKVYLARRKSSGESVALKVAYLRDHNPHALESIRNEICCMAAVSYHLNVVKLHDVFWLGYSNKMYCNSARVGLVMDYVKGSDLQIISKTMLTKLQTWSTVSQVICALQHLHKHGIVHCDVKQENILIERQTGRAVLCDFGAAQFIDRINKLMLGGTLCFMSPERIAQEEFGPKEDVWALGIMTYEMCTGTFYFDSHLSKDILLRKLGRFRLYKKNTRAGETCNQFCAHTIATRKKRWSLSDCAGFLKAVELWKPEPDKQLWAPLL